MRGERQTEERFPVAKVYTEEDRVIFASDGLLLGAIVSASGGDTVVTLRSGVNTSADPIAVLQAKAGETEPVNAPAPLPLQTGLFVHCADTNARVTIFFASASRG